RLAARGVPRCHGALSPVRDPRSAVRAPLGIVCFGPLPRRLACRHTPSRWLISGVPRQRISHNLHCLRPTGTSGRIRRLRTHGPMAVRTGTPVAPGQTRHPAVKKPAKKPASEFKNFTPYKPRKGEPYMNEEQKEHFRGILRNWRSELMAEVDRTVSHMKDEA